VHEKRLGTLTNGFLFRTRTLKFKYLSKMAADEQLDEYVLNGQSLLDLPSDNATYLSVKAIMKATGYIKQ